MSSPAAVRQQTIVTLDLEGVLVPEIWIAVAERTGIAELRRTTRDEPDYDVLMRGRLAILAQHGLTMSTIADVISTLAPMEGAKEFLDDLKKLSSHLANVAAKLDSTEGTAGKLIADPSVYQAIDDILVGVDESKMLRWLVRNRQKAGIEKRYDSAQAAQAEKAKPTPAPAPVPPGR